MKEAKVFTKLGTGFIKGHQYWICLYLDRPCTIQLLNIVPPEDGPPHCGCPFHGYDVMNIQPNADNKWMHVTEQRVYYLPSALNYLINEEFDKLVKPDPIEMLMMKIGYDTE